ncbi:hotdog fold thioesterase, partial [Escherichia coli]|nr:hotdog fold thioesterase [Escherichia coli]
DGQCVVGTELNATHHRPGSDGKVRGVCQPLHLGRQNQTWETAVFDEKGRRGCTLRRVGGFWGGPEKKKETSGGGKSR